MSTLIIKDEELTISKHYINDNANLLYIYDKQDKEVDIIGQKRIYTNVKKYPKEVLDIINNSGVIDL